MRNKKIISVIAIILAFLMAFSLILSVIPVTAHAVSQSDIDAAKEEKERLAEKVAEYDEQLEELKDEHATVMEQKDLLDERNTYIKEQIDLTEEQIAYYTQMVQAEQSVVDAAREKEETQLELYRERVRAMEERSNFNVFTFLMKASNLSELLTAFDDYEDIMQSDRELQDEYVTAREEYEAVLADYETIKTEYEGTMAELETEKEGLLAKMDEVNELLDSLNDDIEKAQEEQAMYAAEKAEVDEEINRLVAELNAQNAAIAAAQAAREEYGDTESYDNAVSQAEESGVTGAAATGVVGTGSLVWPVPSSYRVSSCFKMRNGSMHNGIDIDGYGLDGNPEVACDSGVVVTATFSGNYGNYVVIDHGNGMQTVYAHMSGIAVSAGETVSQGQTIGYLGRTGNATGTHCHLEVIIDGSRVDPLNYFSGYELEPGAAD